MKYLLLLLALVSAIFAPSAAQKEALKIEKGPLLVLIRSPHKNLNKMYPGNFAACLKNHLDYWLWSKGWDCTIRETGKKPKWNSLPDTLKNGAYKYILYLDTKPKFDLVKTASENVKEGKIEGPSIRLILKMQLSLIDPGNGQILIDGRQFQVESLKNWINDSLVPDSARLSEPPDFAIKRLLSDALALLPSFPRTALDSSDGIPIHLVVDSRIYNDIHHGGDSSLITALDYASFQFRRQFGIGLKMVSKDFFTIPEVSFSDIENLFRSFAKKYPSPGDTLMVGVFRPDNPMDFYRQGQNLQIGSSELGRKAALVAQLEMPDSNFSGWGVFLNSQLLLHEIGHLLGAVHVSDVVSIMTRRTAWVSSFRFDKLNSFMIRAGLADKSRFAGVNEYLVSLAAAIDSTGYRLSDYPAIYFSYINLNRKELIGASFGNSAFSQSLTYAVDGYRQYLLKNSLSAGEFFHLALKGAGDQGAIHYYLSRVSDGDQSRRELKLAAEIGYFDAVSKLVSFWK